MFGSVLKQITILLLMLALLIGSFILMASAYHACINALDVLVIVTDGEYV